MADASRLSLEDRERLQDAVKRANQGDQEAVAWVRQFLDANPDIWRRIGDLARIAERAWIELLTNKDVLAAEAIQRQLNQLKTDLLGENPGPIEKLLGDEVVATYLETRFLQTLAADSPAKTASGTNEWLKRAESAQKRHLASVRSLVEIRKLLQRSESTPYLRVFQEYKASG